jgi:hypothetical protein
MTMWVGGESSAKTSSRCDFWYCANCDRLWSTNWCESCSSIPPRLSEILGKLIRLAEFFDLPEEEEKEEK